ncbi:uncharacterized protein PAC_07182 [Phialocephala subalpina]|uniref:Uncharacterized protein n=1 Tax=Phialocephala subalpina TaxID=576137 RepID=A0A1L7WX19_9HELO|nr:uncharacterized protein PAC_07182 [Phialocephala subalpina]
MSPTQEIAQQPQSQRMEMTAQNPNGVVAEQPNSTESMTADPEVSMRGGGIVGDCIAGLCAFECCKGCCECCC